MSTDCESTSYSDVQVTIIFKSTVKRLDAIISISPELRNGIQGLLGNYNNKVEDEAQTPTGETLPTGTHQEISLYGNRCK